MAQLLVFKRDNTHSDPAKDKQGCYKIGDVVVVAEDDHQWGTAELKYPFEVVQVAGTKADYEYLANSDNQLKIPKSTLKNKAAFRAALKASHPETMRRRRYQYTTEVVRKDYA